jgi:hypothetical protein
MIMLLLPLCPDNNPGRMKIFSTSETGNKAPAFFHCQIIGLPLWIDSRI